MQSKNKPIQSSVRRQRTHRKPLCAKKRIAASGVIVSVVATANSTKHSDFPPQGNSCGIFLTFFSKSDITDTDKGLEKRDNE